MILPSMRQLSSFTSSILVALSVFVSVLGAPYSHGFAEPTPQEMEEDAKAKSFAYAKVVDDAVDALVKGDAERFKKMLSPGTLKREQRGPGAIDLIIEERFISFFKSYARLSPNAETISTRDIDGHRGLAIARSFFSADGAEHHFVIYVLDEEGALTVGNLLLDATMADLKRGR